MNDSKFEDEDQKTARLCLLIAVSAAVFSLYNAKVLSSVESSCLPLVVLGIATIHEAIRINTAKKLQKNSQSKYVHIPSAGVFVQGSILVSVAKCVNFAISDGGGQFNVGAYSTLLAWCALYGYLSAKDEIMYGLAEKTRRQRSD